MSCAASVHSHCITRRMGANVCNVCASEVDFQITQHNMQSRMQLSSIGFGRAMGAGGQLAGQALGAVGSGVIGGAARVLTGCASGAVAAVQGLRDVEMPSFALGQSAPGTVTMASSPTRPRALEEYDISEADSGSAQATAPNLLAETVSYTHLTLQTKRIV